MIHNINTEILLGVFLLLYAVFLITAYRLKEKFNADQVVDRDRPFTDFGTKSEL